MSETGLAEGRFIVPQCHEYKTQYNFDAGLDAIFAVSLPIDALSIKSAPRTRDTQSLVISTPEEARAVAAVFGGGESK
jgi:hypothetical protein